MPIETTDMEIEMRPIIENRKLVFVDCLSREFIGIRYARKQLADLEAKDQTTFRPATIARLELLRSGVALWDLYRAK